MNSRIILKKCLTFISSILIITNSFAAIVSDNDGSAFVTKAEFESLKENFANQIQTYNESIDSKIDGAIASYLAGITLEKKIDQDSMINKINDACTDSYISGTTIRKYGYRCMAKSYTVPTTQKPVGAVVNFFVGNILGAEGTNRHGAGWARQGLDVNSRTGLFDVSIPSSGRKNGIYLMVSKYNNKYYADNLLNNITYRYYVTGSGAAATWEGWPPTGSTNDNVTWTFPTFKVEEKEYWKIEIGDASPYWDDATSHGWDNIKVFYGGTYETTENINVVPVTGKISTGTVYGLLTENLTKMTLQESSYNWNLYGFQKFVSRKKTSWYWEEDYNFGKNNNPATTFYFNCHPYMNNLKLSDLIDYNATKTYGEGDVAIYGGLPLFKATNNGIVTMKITFKSVSGSDVYIGLSTSQFSNDETYTIQSDLGLRNASDTKYTSNKFQVNNEYTFVMDVKKDQIVWIKTYDSSSNTGFTGAVTSSIELVSD